MFCVCWWIDDSESETFATKDILNWFEQKQIDIQQTRQQFDILDNVAIAIGRFKSNNNKNED